MGAMATLKEETRDDHVETERTDLSRSMVKGQMRRSHYVMQLVAYARIHRALELRVATQQGELSDLADILGPKSEMALSDLAALQASWQPAGDLEEVLETIEADIETAGIPALLGALYVMEGSGLGASFLLPRLRESLSLREDESRYYNGYGAETFARWKRFGVAVEAQLVCEEAVSEAVLAARALFCNVRRVFELIWDEERTVLSHRESGDVRPSYAPL